LKALGLLSASLVLALFFMPVGANAAGNFAFAVQADNGLKLTVKGYNSSNEEIFEAKISRREVLDGKRYYIVRVDEEILFPNQPLKMVCVEDRSGTWSVLPVGQNVACDTQPVDTRGTYFFVARTFPKAAPTSADAVRCVQDELNALGFDAGTADGVLGNRTKKAGEEYVLFMKSKDAGYVMPTITVDNARLWCQTVAQQNPTVARFWDAIK
jgi:hypothetical protein